MISSGPYYQPLACPQCHQIDSVQKVSALVDAGTSSSLATNGLNNQVSHTQTILSQRLSMPALPTYASPWGPYLLLAIVAGGLALCAWWGMGQSATSFEAFGFILCAILMIGWIIVVLHLGAAAAARRKAQMAASYAGWQQAYTIWQQLYYCHRCDGIFLPGGQSPLLPAWQMRQVISVTHSALTMPPNPSLPS